VPNGLGQLGRVLVGAGAVLAAIGLLLVLADRFPGLRLGRLPGDVSFERGHFRFWFPLGTSLLLSVLASLVLWLLSRR
jgi:hypothetical protein